MKLVNLTEYTELVFILYHYFIEKFIVYYRNLEREKNYRNHGYSILNWIWSSVLAKYNSTIHAPYPIVPRKHLKYYIYTIYWKKCILNMNDIYIIINRKEFLFSTTHYFLLYFENIWQCWNIKTTFLLFFLDTPW
jgi:hypothetical protein